MKIILYKAYIKLWQYYQYKRTGIFQATGFRQKTMAESAFPDHHSIKLYESLFWSSYNEMQENCKEILLLHWKGYNNKEISNQLRIDEASMGKLKTDCILRFLEVVKSHQEYAQFKDIS